MTKRFWQAATTWLLLSNAFEASCLSDKLKFSGRLELLLEKFRLSNNQLRHLPGGFDVRNNGVDLNVLISMPAEYGILEWTLQEQALNIVDAGANIGSFAFFMNCFANISNYVGIEAAPSNYAVLKNNLQNMGPNFTGVQCALTDVRKDMQFELDGDPSRFTLGSSGVHVDGLPLDDIDPVKALPVVDLLKIDVEGGELDLLKGDTSTLASTRWVIMEIHTAQIGEKATTQLYEMMTQNFHHVVYEQSPDRHQSNDLFLRKNSARDG